MNRLFHFLPAMLVGAWIIVGALIWWGQA